MSGVIDQADPSQNVTTFLLIRHGETEENVKKLMQGTQDTQLNERGHTQAQDLALWIEKTHPKIDRIYSSPLQRARKTAEVLAQKINRAIIENEAFQEIYWGVAEGVAIKDLEPLKTAAFTEPDRDKRWAQSYFKGADPYNDILRRAREGLKQIAREAKGEVIAVFTHSRVIRILIDDAFDQEDSEEAKKLGNCAIARFTYDHSLPENNSLQFKVIEQLAGAQH